MTKIDIVSGFLGAGKTTLIRKLLQDALAGTKVVLIENEFGEIGIDGGFLKESGIEIREMNSGCICCSLVGDFGTSLREVMATYAPERILIEPSGVGKLSEVMAAVSGAAEDTEMELNSAVAVVDGSKAKLYIKNFGEFFIDQIEHAGTIILTRTDKMTDAKIDEAVALLREHNEKATIITTPLADLDGRMVLETIEGRSDLQAQILAEVMADRDDDEDEDEHEHHHHHHHHDDDEDEHEHHHHHHHHDDDDDDDEHEHHHHHHDDDDDDEHEHHHHHHDDDDDDMSMSIIITTIMTTTAMWKWTRTETASIIPIPMTTTITIITTDMTRMKYSRAGAWKLPGSIPSKKWKPSWPALMKVMNSASSSGPRAWSLPLTAHGSTLTMFPTRQKSEQALRTLPARSA